MGTLSQDGRAVTAARPKRLLSYQNTVLAISHTLQTGVKTKVLNQI